MEYEKLLSSKLRTISSFYDDIDLDDIYQYVKKTPEWLRDYLFNYLIRDFDDDLGRLITFISDLFKDNSSLMIAITGRQRIGKTIAQSYLSDVLQMGKPIVIYSKEEFEKLRVDMPQKRLIVFPDMSLIFTSRNWDKNIQTFTNSISALSNVYSFSIPFFEEADKAFRLHFEESGMVKIHDRRILNINFHGEKFRIVIPDLPKEIVKEYHKIDLNYKLKAFKGS